MKRRAGLNVLLTCVLAGLLSTSTACRRVESLSALPGVGALEGRCLELQRPMALIDSGGSELAEAYLSPVEELGEGYEDSSWYFGSLDQGAQLRILRVVLESTFENERVVILGQHLGDYSDIRIALFYVFEGEWLRSAWKWATRDAHPKAAQPDPSAALNPTWAEWCTP